MGVVRSAELLHETSSPLFGGGPTDTLDRVARATTEQLDGGT